MLPLSNATSGKNSALLSGKTVDFSEQKKHMEKKNLCQRKQQDACGHHGRDREVRGYVYPCVRPVGVAEGNVTVKKRLAIDYVAAPRPVF